MVVFTKEFGTLDLHLLIVWDKVPKKTFFFDTFLQLQNLSILKIATWRQVCECVCGDMTSARSLFLELHNTTQHKGGVHAFCLSTQHLSYPLGQMLFQMAYSSNQFGRTFSCNCAYFQLNTFPISLASNMLSGMQG